MLFCIFKLQPKTVIVGYDTLWKWFLSTQSPQQQHQPGYTRAWEGIIYMLKKEQSLFPSVRGQVMTKDRVVK